MAKYRKKPETKFCNKCKIKKEIGFWSKNKSTRDGLATQCKDCMAETARKHYAKNKNRVLAKAKTYNKEIGKYNSIRKKYGIFKKDYLIMVKEANGKCAICENPFKKREPYLDHCHKTKVIRGLLCNDCNVGLARFRDNPLLLDRAKEYLGGSYEQVA